MTRTDWYRLLKTVHVLAVVVGFGPSLAQVLIGRRRLPAEAATIGLRVIAPGGAVVLASGLAMTGVGGFWLRPGWVQIGLALWVALAAVGGVLLMLARGGRTNLGLAAAANVLLAAALFVMVWKPGAG